MKANLIGRNDKWSLWFFSFLGLLFVLFHLFTLDISPIPWFDETFFASITSSYTNSGKFLLNIAPYQYSGELFLYGPLYFWTTSLVTQILGFNIFSFRLTALVAGFACIFLFYKIVNIYINKRILLFLITAAFSLDSLFNSNIHAGRMDSLALFFALLSIYLFLKASNRRKYNKSPLYLIWIFSGLFFSLALLTTPRIGVLLLAVGVMQLFYLIKDFTIRYILELIAFWGTIISIYFLWINSAFGSISNLLTYYSGFSEYVGGNYVIPKQQLPLTIITIAAFAFGITINYKRYFSQLVILSAITVSCFYLVINDTGQYSVIIAPFQYALIGMAGVNLISLKTTHFKITSLLYSSPLIAILVFNLAFFTLKSVTLFIASETRNPKHITSFLQSHLLPDTKVIGDEAYFYAVSQAGAQFQYVSIFNSSLEREKYQRLVYDYEYLLWSEKLDNEQPHILELYRKNSILIEVARFSHNKNKNMPFTIKLLNSLNVPVDQSYNGTLYKRIK